MGMQSLYVSNFSCLKSAMLETAGLTILIGPQASGKSVLSKLLYFFNEQISDLPLAAEEGLSALELERRMAEEFAKWFPPLAWGEKVFKIEFRAGPFDILVKRGRRTSQKVMLRISPDMRVYYDTLIIGFNEVKNQIYPNSEYSNVMPLQILSRMQQNHSNRLGSLLEDSFISNQIFIPAGRSWFTTVGKAITAFEHGGLLDQTTLNFGRMFSNAREYAKVMALNSRTDKGSDARKRLSRELFGGELRFERNTEYVQALDGRKIPFNILSSGQQELLPLWLVLTGIGPVAHPRSSLKGTNLIYIEEPEAHLFPLAQSTLLEFLSGMTSDRELAQDMLITTHSPYVLAKINVLLKAGSIASSDVAKAARVAKIVPKTAWLDSKYIRAYAIKDGVLTNILEDGSFIDGDYLDEISNDISRSFNELLEVEFEE